MISNDLVNIDRIVADIVSNVGDERFEFAGKSWYIARVKDALDELELFTHCKEVTIDVLNWQSNWAEHGEYNMPVPRNLFNIKQVFLFNQKENCSDSEDNSFVKVFHKKNFNNFGRLGKRTANRLRERAVDDTMNSDHSRTHLVHYLNIQDGVMAFSSNSNYNSVRVVGKGFSSSYDDIPIVPRVFAKVIKDFVEFSLFKKMKIKDKQYRTDFQDAKVALYGDGRLTNPGSLLLAKRLVSNMSEHEKDTLFMTISNYEI